MKRTIINAWRDKFDFLGARALGFKDDTGTYAGVYYPKHIKDGKVINARWETKVLYKGSPLKIVVWNKSDVTEGKGIADICAKVISVGKEFHCTTTKVDFEQRVFDKGVPVSIKGKPLYIPASIYTITGDIVFGDDDENTVQAEIDNFLENFEGKHTFDMRPPNWNWPPGTTSINEDHFGTTDRWQDRNNYDLWKATIKTRMEHIYDGAPTFGHAKVCLPKGAILAK